MNNKPISHLMLSDRLVIEKGLNDNMPCLKIAKKLDKSDRCISKEVLRHRILIRTRFSKTTEYEDCLIRCKNYELCSIRHLFSCTTKKYQSCNNKDCKNCRYFQPSLICNSFSSNECNKLIKYHYTCNSCNKTKECTLDHYLYIADKSNDMYKELLSKARVGLRVDIGEYNLLNKVLKEGVLKGQSVNHVLESNKEVKVYSKSHIYTLISQNKMDIKRKDLPRGLTFKLPKESKKTYNTIPFVKEGHLYIDYLEALRKGVIDEVYKVELDTVIGLKVQRPCLLTITFPKTKFLLIYYLKSKTSSEVNRVFKYLKGLLGSYYYHKLFPFILTDRGSEFSGYEDIKDDVTKVYFCNPMNSNQKPNIENIHTLIRRVLPKGTSFMNLTDEIVYRIRDHINSYLRSSLGNVTPYEAFKTLYGDTIIKKLGVCAIPLNEVNLTPSLLIK